MKRSLFLFLIIVLCLNDSDWDAVSIGENIYNELDDQPKVPEPYGIAGWTMNDKYILVYDRYDIWKVDPEGRKAPVCFTKYYGRRNNIRLKIVNLNPDNEFISLSQPVILSGTNERTNDSYFFRFTAKDITPKVLEQGSYKFSRLKKAKDADILIWTKQNYEVFPNLIISDPDFKKSVTVSDVNPQQKDFLWGTCTPYQWVSFRGDTLKGLLYKPEDFDSTKEYPVIVYFYERNFFNQNIHFIPTPSRSIINKPFYNSNGYVVFVPDITYSGGYPGQSAYECIVSGTSSLIERYCWIDKAHIGIQGQSWGGYQVAYLVTQTDLFSAAMGGAVVSNMISSYGGIRLESGLNRMFLYEKEQSRIGGSLWEKPMEYIENSPLFYAPKVNTPLLLMHNDHDGAVPWEQGIEYFVALRRLNKPVWLLNYNGQPHNLARNNWANRLDLSKRMKQFFDHYLKGENAPVWMKNGIPAIEKGKNLGYN
jgi:dipeptidyl aminopeptidase/acylaminoacyl peptidase